MTDNIKTVQAIYEAFGRGDVAFILDQLADDVDWASCADSDAAPWYGRRTKTQVPDFFTELGQAAEVTEFTPLAFAANDTDVMAVIRFGMTARATGKSATMDLHHWFRFRDGAIYYYRGTEDTALTRDILSPA